MLSIFIFLLVFSLSASESLNFAGLPEEIKGEIFYYLALDSNKAEARKNIRAFSEINKASNKLYKSIINVEKNGIQYRLKSIFEDEWIAEEAFANKSIFIQYKTKRQDLLAPIKWRQRHNHYGDSLNINEYFALLNRYKIYVKTELIGREKTRQEILKKSIKGIKNDLRDFQYVSATCFLTGVGILSGLSLDGIFKFIVQKPSFPTLTMISGIVGFNVALYAGIKQLYTYFIDRLERKVYRQYLRHEIAERIKFIESHQKNGFLSLPKDYQIPKIS